MRTHFLDIIINLSLRFDEFAKKNKEPFVFLMRKKSSGNKLAEYLSEIIQIKNMI
jgi:hypothetical protein